MTSHHKMSGEFAVYFAARLVLGGVFIYAALNKIVYPERFAELIYNYSILPDELINLTALCLPFVELLAGFLLVLGRPAFATASILTGLTLLFIGALGYNLARGLDFQCGCFTTSPEAKRTGLATLFRDLALLIPALICLYVSYKKIRVKPPGRTG